LGFPEDLYLIVSVIGRLKTTIMAFGYREKVEKESASARP